MTDDPRPTDTSSALPPGSNAEAGPSTLPAPIRSIFSYFSGNGSGDGGVAGTAGPSVASAQPKRKRKKQEEQNGQARFLAAGTGGWVLGKREDGTSASGSEAGGAKELARGRGKANVDEEGQEMREMAKKARASKISLANPAEETKAAEEEDGDAAAAAKSGRSPAKSKRRRKPTENEATPASPHIANQAVDSSNDASPTKRKRGRPPKASKLPTSRGSSQAESSMSRPSPEVINLVSSDPIDGSHRRRASPTTNGAKKARSRVRRISDDHDRPIFLHTASISTKGASQTDPIDIDNTMKPNGKHGPKKLAFASDAKPAHSFFSRLATVENRPRAGSVGSDTAVSECAALSSIPAPVGRNAGKEKGAMVHAFFATNGQRKGKPGTLLDGWGRGVKDGEGWRAPWPGLTWPSHVDAAIHQHALAGSSRRMKPCPREAERSVHWTPSTDTRQHTSPARPGANSRPAILSDLSHPALRALPNRYREENRESWAERYRPRRADELLGNEVEATYMRDWLSALSVGGRNGASARVTRKIKRRKAQLSEGWIIDDIGLFGDEQDAEADDADDDFVELGEPPNPFEPRPGSYPSLSQRLANAILLMGPHGCGKSSAVHAAATELGWDVFEVYPGISKRTGANLMSLVGDVGKNHMVVKGIEAEKQETKPFFGNANVGKGADKDKVFHPQLGSQGFGDEPIEVDEDSKPTSALALDGESELTLSSANGGKFRQSLILLEEVDILFEEESTFWPAVVSLIAESRRPVVMTCNDPASVPLAQLPLQAILQFEPPPRDLAVAYLDLIAKREGCGAIESASLYARCTSGPPDLLNQALPPNGHEAIPRPDLRRAIMQLQLDRGSIDQHTVSPHVASESDLQQLCRLLDNRSYIDAFLAERGWARMETSEVDRYETSPDDQLGIAPLVKPELDEGCPTLPAFDCTQDIASTAMLLDGQVEVFGNLASSRMRYIRSLLPVLDPLIPLSSYLLPHPSLFLDYLPAIQDMIGTDDLLEMAENAVVLEGGERVNRKTGRPIRAAAGGDKGYERHLALGKQALEAARALQFSFQC